jgi:putative ABC transport system substrate-binding protein
VSTARAQIGELALRHRLPSISMFPANADAGGLLAYGPDLAAMFRKAAGLAARILRGVRPAEIPVERPSRFELVANVRTAKALGLVIPPIVLNRADRVVD